MVHKISKKYLVFYDASCHLCNNSLTFIKPKIKSDNVTWVPLQSQLAQDLVPSYCNSMDTIVVMLDTEIFVRSKAVLKLISLMGVPFSILSILLTPIPSTIGDFFYNYIAKRRHFFLKKSNESCQIRPKK